MNTFFSDTEEKSDLVAAGLWTDISVRLLRLPNLEEVTKVKLGGGRLFYNIVTMSRVN